MLMALDTETGGLDPITRPLLSVALWCPEQKFHVRVKANRPCDRKALEINKLDPEMGVEPQVAAEHLLLWWKGMGSPRIELVGQNVGPFDVPFFKQLMHCGVDLPWDLMFDYHYRDTATLALACMDAGLLPRGKKSLGALCEMLNIHFSAHDSLQDAMAAWHVWHRLIVAVSMNQRIRDKYDFEPIDVRTA